MPTDKIPTSMKMQPKKKKKKNYKNEGEIPDKVHKPEKIKITGT